MALLSASSVPSASCQPQSTEERSGKLPFLSVIVPIYNGEADIEPLLACLAAQTYPSDRVEYLLVDNNSQDKTASLLKAAIARLNRDLPSSSIADRAESSGNPPDSFRYLLEADVQSSYAARNRGIRAAKSSILVFTDADCRPEPQWLMEIVQPFTDPEVGIVAGEIVSAACETFLERYSDYVEVLSQKHTLQHSHSPYGQTANLAVRRDAFEQVGLFRPHLTTGGDADMCWRILQGGHWQLRLVEEARVAHRHRATWKDLRSQWKRYGRSNRYLHQLHGVALMQRPYWKEMAMTLLRWLLKRLPRSLWQVLRGRQAGVALVCVPIGLYCNWFRYQGQIQASLPEAATQIEWLAPGQLASGQGRGQEQRAPDPASPNVEPHQPSAAPA